MALTDNLVSYWKLDEASGNALDAHGANDLTETSGTIGTASGKLGGARDFESGDSEHFALADNTDLSTGDIDFTLQAWFNIESIPFTGVILCKGSNVTDWTFEYAFYVNTSNQLVFAVAKSGVAIRTVTWSSTVSTGTWYHAVAWHDSVNNQIGLSVNNGTPVTDSWSSGVNDSADDFRLGDDATGRYFDGLIDEVALWKRVLSSPEREALYNGGAGLAYDDLGGAVLRVQTKSSSGQGVASVTVTPNSATTTGNTLIVVVSSFFTGVTCTVTDGNGHALTQRSILDGGSGVLAVFSRDNITGSAGAITVTPNSGGQYLVVTVLEYSGLESSGSYDQSNGATAGGSPFSSGNVTTTQAAELLVGVNHRLNTTDDYTPDAPWAEVLFAQDGSFHGHYIAQRRVSSTGTYAYTGTGAAGQAAIVTFKNDAGGAAGHPALRRLGLAAGCRPAEVGREGCLVF